VSVYDLARGPGHSARCVGQLLCGGHHLLKTTALPRAAVFRSSPVARYGIGLLQGPDGMEPLRKHSPPKELLDIRVCWSIK